MNPNDILASIVFGGEGGGGNQITKVEELSTDGGASDAGKVLVVGDNGKIAASDLTVGEGEIAVDKGLTVNGAAADAKKTGDAIAALNGSLEDLEDSIESKSLSSELKLALMNLANNVSWVSTDGSAHIEALRQALYPQPPTTLGYVTKGLMALWDGINNTGNGHDSTAAEWTDLISGRKFIPLESIGKTWSFGEESIIFAPTVSGSAQSLKNCIACPNFGRPKTVEICMKFGGTVGSKYFIGFFTGEETDNNGLQIIGLNTDVNTILTYNYARDGAYSYTDFTNMHGLSALYPDNGLKSLYVNGVQANQGGTTNAYTGALPADVRYKYLVIGGHPGYTFKGEIYSVRLYNRVLSTDEIAANYTYDMSRFSMGE